MSAKKNDAFSEVIVGLFMIAVLSLLAYFTIVISGVDLVRGRKNVVVRVDFSDVSGLKPHDNVMYRGTKVGTVDRIDLTPSNLVVTVEIDGARHPMQSIVGRNTSLFDYLGLPAVMAPAGFVAGMPAGVQLVGRPWADDTCLCLAQVLQTVTDIHDRRADG